MAAMNPDITSLEALIAAAEKAQRESLEPTEEDARPAIAEATLGLWCSRNVPALRALLGSLADAQAKSLADEKRIETLESVLRELVAYMDCLNECDHQPEPLANARTALAKGAKP